MSKARTTLLSTTAFVLGLGASAAAAQDATATLDAPAGGSAAASASASTATDLNEVVVTARRRAETAQTTPLSVTALSGEAIEQAGVRRLEELSVRVPNFRASTGAVNPFNFIRGVGSGSNTGFEQAVGVFIDELYLGRGTQAHLPFFDMQQIEVLRGPQVLFLGNSTTGGAISLTTKRPGRTFAGNADASYEFRNQELVLNGGVDIPLGDRAAVRISGQHQDLDRGWLKSVVNGQLTTEPRYTNNAIRAVFEFQPHEAVDLMFKAEHVDLKLYGFTAQAVTNLLNNPAFTETRYDRRRYVGRPNPVPGREQDERNMEQQTYLLRAAVDLGRFELVSTTGYITYDYDQAVEGDITPLPIIDFWQREDYRQFSQELRLSTSFGERVDLLVGGYYQDDALDTTLVFEGVVPPFNFVGARLNRLDQDSRTLSAFFNLTARPVEALEISAGARWTDVRKRGDQAAIPADVITGRPNPAIDGPVFRQLFGVPHVFEDLALDEDELMPEVSVRYNVTPDLMLFGRAVYGAKSGGFDPLYAGADRNLASFRAEKATSYEAGAKGYFADRTVSYALTAFYSEIDDLQVSVFDGRTNYVVGNAAKARSQGAEAQLTWRPSPALTLDATLGYTDFEYLNFQGAGCTSAQNVARPVGCSQDLSGKTGPYVSKVTAALNASYRQEVGPYELVYSASYNYRSAYHAAPSIDPLLKQDGFGLLDARVELVGPDERWRLAVFGRNLTDELFGEVGGDVPGMRGATYLTTSRGRQIGVQLGVNF